MQSAQLIRLESSDQGTFGRLTSGALSLFSGELPDRDNAPNVSCILAGIWPARWTFSPHFGRFLYEIGPVPARAGIREHAANLMGDVAKGFKSQLNGCIAPGERLGWMNGQKAVLLSAPALRRFNNLMGGRPFLLEIIDGYSR